MEKIPLDVLVKRIKSVSTVPDTVTKILELTANSNTRIQTLEEVVKSDPTLTANVLRMVNSSYFALQDKVVEVRRAILLLGFNSMREIAVSASICEYFQSDKNIGNYSRAGLWRHSVAVGLTSQTIAQRIVDIDNDETLFTIGILHDIGIVLFDQYLHEIFLKIMAHPDLASKGMLNLEWEILGFDHNVLASKVVKNWGFPDNISKILYYLQDFDRLGDYRKHGAIIYLANMFCNYFDIGFVDTKKTNPELYHKALNILDFEANDVKILINVLPRELEKGYELMGIVD